MSCVFYADLKNEVSFFNGWIKTQQFAEEFSRYDWRMRYLINKLRIVYLPFILIAAGNLVGYSFLNWLLLIKLELFTLDEELVNLWLPLCLAGLSVFILLRLRVRSLRAKKAKGVDLRGLFIYASWITIAVPVMVAQTYLATATGAVTPLAQISQIEQMPKTKYYTLQDAYFDKADASDETAAHYSGRYNASFNMAVYFACPIEDYASTNHGNVWLGTLYKSQISGHLSDTEREAQFHEFFNNSLAEYNKLDLKSYSYLERLGLSTDGREFQAAVNRNKLYQIGSPDIILEAREGKFSDRNGSKLAWVFGSFGIGAGVCFLILLAAPVDSKEMRRLLSGDNRNDELPNRKSGNKNQEAEHFFRLVFIPNRFLTVAPLLVDINIAVFGCMVLAGLGVVSFSSSDLLRWGANFRPALLSGEYWRLVVSIFVHGGLMHLVGNLFTLFLVGVVLEPKLGHMRFLICYLVCGIAGSLASVAWHPATVSVGASGAIMGVLGVLLGMTFLEKGDNGNQKNSLIKLALFIVGYNLLMGFVMGGVDNAAHLGGLGCGLFLGALFGLFPGLVGRRQSKGSRRYLGHTGTKIDTEKLD